MVEASIERKFALATESSVQFDANQSSKREATISDHRSRAFKEERKEVNASANFFQSNFLQLHASSPQLGGAPKKNIFATKRPSQSPMQSLQNESPKQSSLPKKASLSIFRT